MRKNRKTFSIPIVFLKLNFSVHYCIVCILFTNNSVYVKMIVFCLLCIYTNIKYVKRLGEETLSHTSYTYALIINVSCDIKNFHSLICIAMSRAILSSLVHVCGDHHALISGH